MSLYLHRYGAFHTDSEIPIVNVAANQKMVLMGFITMTGDIEKTSNGKTKEKDIHTLHTYMSGCFSGSRYLRETYSNFEIAYLFKWKSSQGS